MARSGQHFTYLALWQRQIPLLLGDSFLCHAYGSRSRTPLVYDREDVSMRFCDDGESS